jgi:hypothetical protein
MDNFLHLIDNKPQLEREILERAFSKNKLTCQDDFPTRIKGFYNGYTDSTNWFELIFLDRNKVDYLQYNYKDFNHQIKRIASDLEPKTVQNQEFNWFQKNYTFLKNHYLGQWVAIVGDQLIGHGDSFADVIRITREKHYKRPFITCISPERWEE